tara:strand:- start:689 stop:997 length:309 start_codon:yes stop_codon:yes gene_type:complete
MYYKIKGIILNSEIKTVESKKGDSFEKLYVTIEEKETGNDFKHQFELFGSEAIQSQKDKIKINGLVTIEFYIRTNEWKNRFFNSLNIKNIIEEQEVKQDLPF